MALKHKLIHPVILWIVVLLGVGVAFAFFGNKSLFPVTALDQVLAGAAMLYWALFFSWGIWEHHEMHRSAASITHVVEDGPYAVVRHPVYAANIVLAWGLFLLFPTLPALEAALWVSVVLLGWIHLEELALRERFGKFYEEYQLHVPLIIPRFRTGFRPPSMYDMPGAAVAPERELKNFGSLASTDLRRAALEILEAGLHSINTRAAIERSIKMEHDGIVVAGERYAFRDIRRIHFVGIGKCAVEAALAVERILGTHLAGGIAIDVKETQELKRIRAFRGTHPLPSLENILITKEIVRALRGLDEHDLVIFVVSGGGSVLLCYPEDRGCEEEIKIFEVLTKAGATIQELNTIRKHLSLARGGYLAKAAYPAHIVGLIFSDVPGDDVQYIASGPTIKDTTTVADAERLLEKYDVTRVCHVAHCGVFETPKEDKYFERVRNVIVVSNTMALDTMQKIATAKGFTAKVRTNHLTGEARTVGRNILEELKNEPPKSVLLYGGETTVVIRGHGRGGRNLEVALSTVSDTEPGHIVVSAASDGHDNSDFGGALADLRTKERAIRLNLNPQKFLDESNSYEFFLKVGDYLRMGDTGSNVSDLIIALKQ